MTLAVGLVLILLAMFVSVIQVRRVARSAQLPVQWQRVSQCLPPTERQASNLVIGTLAVAGAFTIEHGRPGWTFYAAGLGAVAMIAVAQAVAVRVLSDRAKPQAPVGG